MKSKHERRRWGEDGPSSRSGPPEMVGMHEVGRRWGGVALGSARLPEMGLEGVGAGRGLSSRSRGAAMDARRGEGAEPRVPWRRLRMKRWRGYS